MSVANNGVPSGENSFRAMAMVFWAGLLRWQRGRAEWKRRGVVVATMFAFAFSAWLTATQFPASGNDDSHITFFAAHQLARDGSIANYNAERVEQSSSLLLVLLLAAVQRVTGVAPPVAAYAVSILSALGCLLRNRSGVWLSGDGGRANWIA